MEPQRLKPLLLNFKAAALLFMITVTLFFLSRTTADPDLWGYLAFGRLFWGQKQFPYQDVFAFVPTLKPWIYHEWLTGVLFYPLYRGLGASGLQVLKFALGLATLGAVYLTARRRGADLLPTALLWFVALGGMTPGYGPVRAQVFTYFFFAVYLYVLETARLSENRRWLWVLVPIQIVWCNLHGGFLAGLGLILLYALGEALSRRPCWTYLGCFVLAGLATLINPYGLQYWSYLVHAVMMPRPEITEWFSMFEAYQQGYLPEALVHAFFFLIGWAVFVAWSLRWRELTPTLVFLVTIYLAVKHNRHLVFFGLAFGAYMPALLSVNFRVLQTRPGVMAWGNRLGKKIPAVVLVLLSGAFAFRFFALEPFTLKIPGEPKLGAKVEMYYPTGAIDYLEQRHVSGKLLAHFNWGEYCIWRLYPQCLVAIDGRYETVYPGKVYKEYDDFMMARKGWHNFLQHYPPDLILIAPQSKVYGFLSCDPEWRQVYADTGCVLFRRQSQISPGPGGLPPVPVPSFKLG
jgi:hypothetical protein